MFRLGGIANAHLLQKQYPVLISLASHENAEVQLKSHIALGVSIYIICLLNLHPNNWQSLIPNGIESLLKQVVEVWSSSIKSQHVLEFILWVVSKYSLQFDFRIYFTFSAFVSTFYLTHSCLNLFLERSST